MSAVHSASPTPASGAALEPTSNPKKSKTTWHLHDVPPTAYRLPADGRKWRASCVSRQRVAIALARFADSNGRNIQAGQERLAASLGMSRRELGYLLSDLLKLKFLRNEGLVWTHGKQVRRRSLDIAAILIAASGVQDSQSDVQYSQSGVQDSTGTQPCLEPSDSTFLRKQGIADAMFPSDSSRQIKKKNQEPIPPDCWYLLLKYIEANLQDIDWRAIKRDRGALRALWAVVPDVDEIIAAFDQAASVRDDAAGVFSMAHGILRQKYPAIHSSNHEGENNSHEKFDLDLDRARSCVHSPKPTQAQSASPNERGIDHASQKVGGL
jgi:hypothetical protein